MYTDIIKNGSFYFVLNVYLNVNVYVTIIEGKPRTGQNSPNIMLHLNTVEYTSELFQASMLV